MALIVETGAGVAGANSYISLADAQAFLTSRGLNVTLSEGQLLQAMDAMALLNWKGYKVNESFPLDWPRSGVVDRDGFTVGFDSIPAKLSTGQVWLAYHIASGAGLNKPSKIAYKKERVEGAIDVEYAVGNTSTPRTTAHNPMSYPNVYGMLRDLVCSRRYLEHA